MGTYKCVLIWLSRVCVCDNIHWPFIALSIHHSIWNLLGISTFPQSTFSHTVQIAVALALTSDSRWCRSFFIPELPGLMLLRTRTVVLWSGCRCGNAFIFLLADNCLINQQLDGHCTEYKGEFTTQTSPQHNELHSRNINTESNFTNIYYLALWTNRIK